MARTSRGADANREGSARRAALRLGSQLDQVAKAEEILSYFSTKTYFCHS
jgi:hypothetical protein